MRAAQPMEKKARVRQLARPDNPYSAGHDLVRTALVLGYACLLAWAIRRQAIAFEFAFATALMSIAAFLAYATDKHAAQTGRWRIPEANLHVLELLGGWPGALFSQRVLRHKTCKAGYRVVFRMMLGMNLAATIAWIYWKS